MTALTCRSSGSHTTRSLRSMTARDFGPGNSVFISIVGIASSWSIAALRVDRSSTSRTDSAEKAIARVATRQRSAWRPRSAGAELPEASRRRRERVERSHELLHGPDQALEPAQVRRILPEPAGAVARLRE